MTKNKQAVKDTLPVLATKNKDVKIMVTYRLEKSYEVSKMKPNNISALTDSILSEIYSKEAAYWNRYDTPVIKEDGTVLKNWEDVLAAKNNGETKMDVIVVENLNEDEEIRFINFSMYFKKMTCLQRFLLISELEQHLKNTDKGKEWAKEIRNGRRMDINELIGEIAGYHRETIKDYKFIGVRGVKYFDERLTIGQMQFNAMNKVVAKFRVPNPEKVKSKETEVELGTVKLVIGSKTFQFTGFDKKVHGNTITYTDKYYNSGITIRITNPQDLEELVK